jgi:hypothetical protein
MRDTRRKIANLKVFKQKIGQSRWKQARQNAKMRQKSFLRFIRFRFIAPDCGGTGAKPTLDRLGLHDLAEKAKPVVALAAC